MPDLEELAQLGAQKVLQECLTLKSGEVVAIFYDEKTAEPANLLIAAARRLGLQLRVKANLDGRSRIFCGAGNARALR